MACINDQSQFFKQLKNVFELKHLNVPGDGSLKKKKSK